MPSSICTMKGQLCHSLSLTGPSALFLSVVRDSPIPAADNTSLHVLIPRSRVVLTLNSRHLSEAESYFFAVLNASLPSHCCPPGQNKGERLLTNSGILCWRLSVF